MAEYAWPDAAQRALLGKRHTRLDGPAKSSGRATYAYDVRRPNMLYGKMVTSPHAHARVVSIDTSAADAMPGVKAIDIIMGPAKEIQWASQEVVAVAAETEEQARDAAERVRVEYEVLPFFVRDTAPSGLRTEQVQVMNEQKEGDPDQGFRDGEVSIEGTYGSPVITHCCLEAHGQVCEWEGENLTVWATTQAVSGIGPQFAEALGIPASSVRILTPYMGGGFGSKFAADTWGISCARLAKKAGRPVKMMLERGHDLMVGGCRPSMYAHVRVAAKRDGTLTAWSSESWGTGGVGPAGNPQLPYVFAVANRSSKHTRVSTNIGPARAWRAPNHPQMCLITMSALDDLAAAARMDPLELLLKNIALTGQRSQTYRDELLKCAELMDWKRKWHPRGDPAAGPIKRGVGLSLHTWGGGGHESNSIVTIFPDGAVEVNLASQDLGTGTRTVIAIVVAETLGLPLQGVKVNIGDSRYPQSGASGGSTTVGGVSSSTRVAATDAFNSLAAQVAPALGVKPEELEAKAGRIRVKANPAKGLSWKQACARLGGKPLSANGTRNRSLISSGVCGVQMAEVSVDVETGVVQMEKLVAVQDCGLVVDLTTAESQVYGALIMGICYALYEEKLMDDITGKCLNPDMEFYKLAGAADIGELVVHMMTGPGYDERGMIGLGEPPVISPGAAISNAVANATGKRVSTLPLTPDRVLAALGGAAI
jgi:xanthine dehydrogenase YagR molybdenum-binding subunit